ncbi:MAG TPA: flagellar basal-body MS-ring/collar protein FliF [Aminivibrio sp.]|jgi:flagellar M-ring protein FliF|uniref:flagellar basal-body MS-ring/collar protein FliF n=1 Tax=Aminivibrio sp. TaxID=1872489 RepID=UPI002B21B9B1|nr:flagellar basal-body MS-ring/collar protein FliF [Aminivibrio sp.]MDD3514413.1 flagellar basal-body MS-ring/collar protein FliF [Synergistaceae bacterium]NCB16883.1 flagellar M-ring protein FliF [Synergistales bacterium]MEA4952002.1 flagellar basal-body MS-ring/collar protein FliF [Aminivibrio sp.]HPF83799.1 flagellar basal-body MS-ring/collar protein FliF [Aminivibrio sp.]HRX26397.1 flagellar basal-body MS-ring/collar protein FliF [Aminivibrio sp.]
MDWFRRFSARLGLFWSSLKPWQKLSIVGASILVVSALVLAAYWAGKPSYEPLFSALEVEDQSAIVAYLRENRIDYKLDPAANAILVPRDIVYETRLSLAQGGLPKGGSVGYEIFDTTKMGLSEFQQKITYIRALEGELERTIRQIDAVDYAKVNIVIPEQRLFLEQQQPSTASVLVRLKTGMQIGPDQVKSIVHLVSHGVQGLLPENITVVDTTGKVLSDLLDQDLLIYGQGGDGRTVSSVQRELERQQERELENKVRVMLERVFGPGRVVVRIKVDLDFDRRTSSSKEFIPGETGRGVLRSQQNMEETYTGTGGPIGGAPGTTTNIPGYAVAQQQGTASEYNKTETTNNYEITTRETQQVVTPGTIRRLSASVLVDGDLEQDRLTELRALVAPALGVDAARGDQLVIQSMKFSTTFADSLAEQLQAQQRMQLIIALVAAAVILLLAALAGVLWMKRRRSRKAMLPPAEERKRIPSIQELLSSPELLEAQGELAVLEEQLRAYARSKPEEIANLTQDWLADEA